MTYSFSFEVERGYSSAEGIIVPVTLHYGPDGVSFEASIDTGSIFCIFNRGHAETLGLNVESADATRFSTVTGTFEAYGHMLTLETLGYTFDVTVYFAAHESYSRNVLGRRGWLDQVKLGIVEYESKLYLSAYEQ